MHMVKPRVKPSTQTGSTTTGSSYRTSQTVRPYCTGTARWCGPTRSPSG